MDASNVSNIFCVLGPPLGLLITAVSKTQVSNSGYAYLQGGPKKTDTQFYFFDNFGNSAPILTILSLLQAEIYGA